MQSNQRIFNIVLYSLMGLSAILCLMFFFGALDAGQILAWCYILFGAAIAVSVVFPIIVMAKDPKKAKSALIGIAGLGIIFAIGYGMAGSETYKVGEEMIGEAVSRRSGAGLISFYILIILAIAAIVYSEISKALK